MMKHPSSPNGCSKPSECLEGHAVIPAYAGIQYSLGVAHQPLRRALGSRFRGNDVERGSEDKAHLSHKAEAYGDSSRTTLHPLATFIGTIDCSKTFYPGRARNIVCNSRARPPASCGSTSNVILRGEVSIPRTCTRSRAASARARAARL